MSINVIQREPSLASTTSAPSLAQIRHRRFFRNRQRRRDTGHSLHERDDDDDDDEVKVKAVDANGDEISSDDDGSSDDESSTKTLTGTTTSAQQTSAKPTLAATTTTSALVASTTSLQATTSATPTLALTTAISSTTPPPSSTAKSSFSAAPDLLSSSSTPNAQSDTGPLKATFTSTYTTRSSPTKPPISSATGLGQNVSQNVEKTHMAPGEIAGIVFGIMGAILFVFFILIWYIRRNRRAKLAGEYNEKPSGGFGGLGAWRRNRDSGSAESRIWGGTTSYGARTEVDIPAYVPASMQPGGQHYGTNLQPPLPTHQNFSGSQLSRDLRINPASPADQHSSVSSGIPTFPGPPPAAAARVGEMRDGVLRVPTRWFSRDSIASVPRFRDIKSWAVDQRDRVASSSLATSIGKGSADSVTGIPKNPGRYAQL